MNEYETILPSPTNIRKKAIQESMQLFSTLLVLLVMIFFLAYCDYAWRETMNSAIFCPKNVDPYNVVERYHEYHLIKVLDKNTDEIKKSYGEDGDVRLRLFSKDAFLIEVSVIENSEKLPKSALIMHKIDPGEYVQVETKYKYFENKDWGLKK